MRTIAFYVLVLIVVVSVLPQSWGFVINSNTVALSLMVLLLVLFSELVEFNFWGLKGKKLTPPPQTIDEDTPVVNSDAKNLPSKYKLTQAQKEESVNMLPNTRENFLALSFDIERLLRIIARSMQPRTEVDTLFTSDKVDDIISAAQVLTTPAQAALSHIRDFRETLLTESLRDIPIDVLEGSHSLAYELHSQLQRFISNPTSEG